ncbi:hypothetical protein [Streptomyces sp. 2A115]|uniref:hypothetical protein n=1 Tax=Streptomyces sp. 2A115 TaxID=3457439 RepID=UPI003FCF4F64
MSAYEQPPLDLGAVCQRWRNRRHSWRPRSEGGFDSARYRVRELPNDLVHAAKAFVLAHHYSASWPVRFAYGLTDTAAPSAGQLVGVLTLGIPTQVAVVTSVFGRLIPYEESLERNSQRLRASSVSVEVLVRFPVRVILVERHIDGDFLGEVAKS